jgi:hypothetical protein
MSGGWQSRIDLGIGALTVDSSKVRQNRATFVLIFDAKHSRAKTIYTNDGLTTCIDVPMTFFLPLGN